jgi:pimeloyl-ACP methyl ester carboxylesterase
MTDQDTVSTPKATKRKHRKWPWILLTIFVLLIVAAWLGIGAYGDSYIANNGKDTAPLGSCPLAHCSTVTYSPGLDAWYGAPAKGNATVIFVHGYGANRADHAQVGVDLQHLGYGVLAIDLGYEGNKMHYGGGVRESNDVVAAATFARAHGASAVVVVGYSAGGTAAILAASNSTLIRAVVADSAPVSFIHLATDRVGAPTWIFSAAPMLYSFFSSGGTLGSLSSLPSTYSTPTLIIQGTSDQTVDFSNGPAIAKLTHGQLWTINGGTHTSAAETCPSAYISQLNKFFTSAIAGSAASFTVNQGC